LFLFGIRMQDTTYRFAVTFRDGDTTPEEIARTLARPTSDVIALQSIWSQNETSTVNSVVHFPDCGTAYLRLTEDERTRLLVDDRILSVRQVQQVCNGGQLLSVERARSVGANRPFLVGTELTEPTLPWNITMVDADQVWPRSRGRGVKVAVLDNGINRNRSDLTVAGGVSFVPGIDDWNDDDGHGTHCAGIIAANAPEQGVMGVAPECSLYAVKVMSNGRGDIDHVICGMRWAAENKMDVVSMSLWKRDGPTTDEEEAEWGKVQEAAQALIDSGCLVVGISGNSGNSDPHWVTNPGRCPGIVAVGAVDKQSAWWDESSFGPPELPVTQGVEVTAPGVEIRSTYLNGDFATYSGTSMACPHVAGAAALVKSLNPGISVDELREKLRASATDEGPPGFDEKYGAGLLNCLSATR
jgi:subtilisin family serine protease